jgi:hypothetical protein
MPQPAPEEVTALARRRAEARLARDFETADDLRREIEDAGWKVVDVGQEFRLEPAHPPDEEIDGVIHYGSSATVPSRLSEPPTGPATVVLVAGDDPDLLAGNIAALQGAPPSGTHIVVVAAHPAGGLETVLSQLDPSVETVRLVADAGLASCWNAGIRRATGSVVVLIAPGAVLRADVTRDLVAALEDEGVAIVGWIGLASDDLRRWERAGGAEADAVDAEVLAFRRSDAAARGPLDERFVTPRPLAVWWSLVLRDAGPESAPRRALALQLPAESRAAERTDERDRAARRDFYRVVDRFGRRHDMLREPVRPTAGGATGHRR